MPSDLSVRLVPKLVTVLREGIPPEQLARDVTAGVIVAIVVLPLAVAFAIASGVKPEQGLVTAVVAGFLISALGGSRVQIGGPTGAFVVLVYGVVARHGYEGLAVATSCTSSPPTASTSTRSNPGRSAWAWARSE